MKQPRQSSTHRKSNLFCRTGRFLVLVLVCSVFASTPSFAAPKSELWDRWLAQDPSSTLSVDHDAWNLLLIKYVYPEIDGINRMAYGSMHAGDRNILDKYIVNLAAMAVTRLNRNEQMAYWINLYNALTVQLVLKAYPVSSIRDIDISPGLFSDGPWDKKLVVIEGQEVSLNDIEHRILRPIWKDPRIHYVLNCASLGCPNLGKIAVTAENLDQFLDDASRAFINHPRAIGDRNGGLYASSIYDWYAEDFGDSEEGVLKHLRSYADAPLLETLGDSVSIRGYGYDWTLNSVTPTTAQK